MAIWDILDVVAAVGTSGVGSLMFLSFGFPNSIVTVRRNIIEELEARLEVKIFHVDMNLLLLLHLFIFSLT